MEFDQVGKQKSYGIFKDLYLIAIILCAVMFVFTFVTGYIISPVIVENISMMPTLHEGDMRFVLKTKNVKAGDIVVFSYEDENMPKTMLVKRLIAVEGEYVFKDGERVYVKDISGQVREAYKDYKEFYGTITPTLVPKGHFYAMGDNINVSQDSTELGCFSFDSLVGKML